jgi:hypothetical protein
MRFLLLSVLTVLAILAGPGCRQSRPRQATLVYVFSQAQDALELGDELLRVGYSNPVTVPNGAIDTLSLTRHSASLGKLIVTSLVPVSDPETYDAAINIHEDTVGLLSAREFSPHIDAVLIRP